MSDNDPALIRALEELVACGKLIERAQAEMIMHLQSVVLDQDKEVEDMRKRIEHLEALVERLSNRIAFRAAARLKTGNAPTSETVQ